MTRPVIVIGGGGHAKVLIDTLLLSNSIVLGYVAPADQREKTVLGVKWIGDDESLLTEHAPESVQLVNGIGSVGVGTLRKKVYDRFKAAGFTFATVIHPSAILSPSAKLAEGVQVLAGVVVQAESSIGANTILNTRSSIDHDCVIGAHVHIAPGTVLSGGVAIGDGAHLGTGAVVIQGQTIGEGAVVGAGAVVVRNVPSSSKVMGVPAREGSR